MGAETGIKTAAIMAIAEGTAYLYLGRVTQAFRNIRDDHLFWPDEVLRDLISEEIEEEWEFFGCISIGDGTYIFLTERPSTNGYAFWCRKKRYAVCHQP